MRRFLANDENVKAMRETARTIGLTRLLVALARSARLSVTNHRRLRRALDLLGAADSRK